MESRSCDKIDPVSNNMRRIKLETEKADKLSLPVFLSFCLILSDQMSEKSQVSITLCVQILKWHSPTTMGIELPGQLKNTHRWSLAPQRTQKWDWTDGSYLESGANNFGDLLLSFKAHRCTLSLEPEIIRWDGAVQCFVYVTTPGAKKGVGCCPRCVSANVRVGEGAGKPEGGAEPVASNWCPPLPFFLPLLPPPTPFSVAFFI